MSSQPPLNQAYNVAGNPASKEPAEEAQAQKPDNSNAVDQRTPQDQTISSDQATPTASGQGVTGAAPGENASDLADGETSQSRDVDADEQMAAPGEGKVADAVKSGGIGGGEPGLETDLDRKKAEQAPKRAEVKAQEKKDVDVGGVLGQRGGPANPVD